MTILFRNVGVNSTVLLTVSKELKSLTQEYLTSFMIESLFISLAYALFLITLLNKFQ